MAMNHYFKYNILSIYPYEKVYKYHLFVNIDLLSILVHNSDLWSRVDVHQFGGIRARNGSCSCRLCVTPCGDRLASVCSGGQHPIEHFLSNPCGGRRLGRRCGRRYRRSAGANCTRKRTGALIAQMFVRRFESAVHQTIARRNVSVQILN